MTHSLIPPPELIQELAKSAGYKVPPGWLTYALEKVFQAGADQELEACCKYMQHEDFHGFAAELRAARRPKPPSLKEQALAILASVAVCELHGDAAPDNRLSTKDIDTIRRALEALSDDQH